MREPLLSVCLITYNHVKYIKEAIDGVLMQKVNFSWELIIADDFSIDGTREIVLEYKKKYPDFIKLILQEKNVGAAQNWMDLITYPKSKYIAYFEGDDYWTDSQKLQKQVDFLEENEDYGLVHTDFKLILENGLQAPMYREHMKNRITDGFVFPELLKFNFIGSLTCCIRTNYLKDLSIVAPSYAIDYWYWLKIAQQTKIKYLNLNTAVYRIHNKGFSWDSSQNLEEKVYLLKTSIIKEYIGCIGYGNLTKKEREVICESLLHFVFYSNQSIKEKINILNIIIRSSSLVLTSLVVSIKKILNL